MWQPGGRHRYTAGLTTAGSREKDDGYWEVAFKPGRLYFPKRLNVKILLKVYFFVQHFRVGIRFVAFDIENHVKCMYDYLQVYDGPDDSSPVMGRYCGKVLPKELKSNSSQVTIQFSSDGTISKPGFYLNYFSGNNHYLLTDLCVFLLNSLSSVHPHQSTERKNSLLLAQTPLLFALLVRPCC